LWKAGCCSCEFVFGNGRDGGGGVLVRFVRIDAVVEELDAVEEVVQTLIDLYL
jgi:hypothetical protein